MALCVFIAFSIFAVVSPYLAVLLHQLGYRPGAVGLLLGIFELSGIAGPLFLGRSSDRIGKYRPNLLLASAFILAGLWPLVLVRSIPVAVLSLSVFAVGIKSLLPLLDAALTISIGSKGDYGRVRVLGSISFVLTALAIQYIPFLRPQGPTGIGLWILATTVLFVFSLFWMKEGKGDARPRRPRGEMGGAKASVFTEKAFVMGLILIAFTRLAMAPISSFFSLYVVDELHWNAIGLLWAISACSEIPFMFLSARLIRRFGSPRILAVAGVAIAVRLLVYAIFPSKMGAVTGQLLHSICFGLFHPAAVTFVATRIPPEQRGTGMTIYLSLGTGLPTFLGSALGGLIVELYGYRALFASYSLFALVAVSLYFFARSLLESPVRASRG